MTAARIAVSHATVVITNPAVAACLTLVQPAQSNAREGFHKRVPAVFGLEVQNVVRIRFAAAVRVNLAQVVSMFRETAV